MRKCMCCNQENENLKGFTMTGRGKESKFHGDNFTIELCEECILENNVIDEWFTNNTYEDDLLYFIETEITEPWALELIWNCENDLVGRIDSEDWERDMLAAFSKKYERDYDNKYTPKNEWSKNLTEEEEIEVACAYAQNWMN